MINRNYGLDVLRAIAIILVILCHALFFMIQAFPQSNAIKLISYFCGFWGVELFFVLSGFLIGKIIREQLILSRKNWLISFWIRRWFRTIPCYFLFLLLNTIWFYYLHANFPDSLFSYFIFTQNLAWEHPAFFPEAWSLSIEEWFYVLFPVAIILIKKGFINVVNTYLISGAILLIVPTMLRLICVALEPSLVWDAGIRKIVIFRLDSLMYGIYLSWFIDSIKLNHKKTLILLLVGLVTLFISMTIYFNLDYEHSYFSKTLQFSITSLGFMLIIPYILDFKYAKSTILGVFIRKTALWSYSIYLSNFLIYNMIQNLIFLKYLNKIPLGGGAFFCLTLLIISTYLISAIIYRTYELPLTNLRDPVILWLKIGRK